MSLDEHIEKGRVLRARCAVITCSDTRDESSDTSGALVEQLLLEAGHEVTQRTIVQDEPSEILAALEAARGSDIRLLIINGGTGISRRDSTFEAISQAIDTPLPGFGELFRMLSFEDIGAAAMMSRATAGLSDGMFVFSLPGSRNAVDLAMRKLILPQIVHLLAERS